MAAPSPSPPPLESGRWELRVPAMLRAVSRVRRAIEALGLPPPLLDDARLLATELVTNSVRHAGLRPDDTIQVRADWSGTRLRVDVRDRVDRATSFRLTGAIQPSPGAESGWGLFLVDRLASRWGSSGGNSSGGWGDRSSGGDGGWGGRSSGGWGRSSGGYGGGGWGDRYGESGGGGRFGGYRR